MDVTSPIDTSQTRVVTSSSNRDSDGVISEASNKSTNDEVEVTSSTPNNDENLDDVMDEIGVTLDYEFPEEDADETRTEDNERNQQQRHQRRRHRRYSFWKFYRKHWFGQFVSGVFTSLLFLTVGILFVTHFYRLPTYIGILFIFVSFPPCCLAVNRLRQARADERIRLRNRERLRMLRRLHQQSRTDDVINRQGSLPLGDLPPAYNNLAFVDETRSMSVTSSAFSETDLPSYQEAIRIKQQIEEELSDERICESTDVR